MAYIGKQPTVGNFQVCDAITVVNGQAAYTMQVSSANVEPENANHMLVSLNGVLQKPGSSFTISGATITFASNLATGDVIDFIILLGNVLDIGTPSDNGVTTASIAANAVTAAKLNNDVISGLTALTDAPATTDEFLVSDAGTLKRIDASLIGGGNLVHLQTQTASSDVANITFTSTYLTSTYTTYFITGYVIFDNIAQLDLFIHPSIDNGSNYNLTCASNAEGRYADTSGNGAQHEPSPFANNYIYVGTDAKKGSASDTMGMVCFSGYMWNSLDYSKVDVTSFNFVNNRNYENTHTMPGYCGGNVFNAGSIVNNFKIQCETGNIETGSKISLFGVKQS